MLDLLKSFDDGKRMDISELVALASFGRVLQSEFQELGVESPEWLGENLSSVRREIKARNADRLASKLKSARARLETLKTPDEKRKSVEDEIAALEAKLQEA